MLRVFCQRRTDCESTLVLSPLLFMRGAVTGSALDKHEREAHSLAQARQAKTGRGTEDKLTGFRQAGHRHQAEMGSESHFLTCHSLCRLQ